VDRRIELALEAHAERDHAAGERGAIREQQHERAAPGANGAGAPRPRRTRKRAGERAQHGARLAQHVEHLARERPTLVVVVLERTRVAPRATACRRAHVAARGRRENRGRQRRSAQHDQHRPERHAGTPAGRDASCQGSVTIAP